jgi:heat shock protein HslJ
VARRCCTALVRCLLVGSLVLGAAGCGEDTDVTAGPDPSTPDGVVSAELLDGRTFTATSLEGHDLVPGTEVSLAFEADRLSTNAGCNTQSGGYRIEDATLVVADEWMSTLIGCPAELEAQDRWLAQFLAGSPRIELRDDRLVLRGADAAMTLSAADADADSAASLTGTDWVLGSVSTGGTSSSVPAGVEPPTLRIDEDGMAELFTGCNRGGAAVGTSSGEQGPTLSFGPIRLTKMACSEAAMALETTVVSVLESGPAFSIAAASLVLTAPDGTALEFRAA